MNFIFLRFLWKEHRDVLTKDPMSKPKPYTLKNWRVSKTRIWRLTERWVSNSPIYSTRYARVKLRTNELYIRSAMVFTGGCFVANTGSPAEKIPLVTSVKHVDELLLTKTRKMKNGTSYWLENYNSLVVRKVTRDHATLATVSTETFPHKIKANRTILKSTAIIARRASGPVSQL